MALRTASAGSGGTHDIVIVDADGVEHGLMLALQQGRKLWQAGAAPVLPGRLATAASNYANFPADLDLIWSQSDWRGGLGRKQLGSSDTFWYAKGLYSRNHGYLHLAPAPQRVTQVGNAAIGAGSRFMAQFGGADYLARDTQLFRLDAGGTVVTLVKTFPLAITHLFAYQGWLLAAQGDATKHWYSTDGAAWVQSVVADAEGTLFAERTDAGVSTLWKAKGNSVRSSTDPTVTWNGTALVGATALPVKGLYTQVNTFLQQKEDGLYGMNSSGAVVQVYRAQRDSSLAVQAGVMRGGDLFIPDRFQLLRYTQSGVLADVGLGQPSNAPSPIFGRVWSMCEDGQFLYGALEANDGNWYVIIGEELASGDIAWDVLVDCGPLSCKLVYLSDLYGANRRLYFGNGSGLSYVILSRYGSDFLSDPNCKFVNYGVIYSSINDFDFAAAQKTFDRWTLRREDTGGGIALWYSIDGGAWRLASGETGGDYLMGRAAAGVRIQYKLEFRCDDPAKTPVLRSIVEHGRLRIKTLQQFQFTVRCADDVLTLQGQPYEAGPALAAFLRSLRDEERAIELWDRFGVGWRVSVADASDMEVMDAPGHKPEMAVQLLAYGFDQHTAAVLFGTGRLFGEKPAILFGRGA
jgi:hypothetical protein